jgi:uncharacterized membrane protein YbhN (UPF0104 family)
MHQKRRRFNVSLWPGGRPLPVRLLVALLATVALLVLLSRAPWSQLLAALRAANLLWLGLAMLASASVFPLWIAQWRALAGGGATTVPRMAEVVALSALANATLFKVAGLASAGVLLVGRAGLTAAAAVSVLTLDQLLAGLAKVLVLGLAVMLVPLPVPAVEAMLGFSALVLGLAGIVVLLARRRSTTPALAATASPAITRVAAFLDRVSDSLAVLRSPGRTGLVLLLAIAKKTAEVMTAYAVQLACGIDASPAAAVLVVAAVGLVAVLPIVPGNLGVFTAGVFAAYRFLGVDPAPALAAGLLLHAVEFLPTLAFGYGALLAGRRSARLARRAASPQPP